MTARTGRFLAASEASEQAKRTRAFENLPASIQEAILTHAVDVLEASREDDPDLQDECACSEWCLWDAAHKHWAEQQTEANPTGE